MTMIVVLLSFLVFSLLVYSSSPASPPPTGSCSKPGSMSEEDEASSAQDFLLPLGDATSDNIGMDAACREVFYKEAGEGLGLMEGRMVIQSNDYPGTGANNHHDPKPPTRD